MSLIIKSAVVILIGILAIGLLFRWLWKSGPYARCAGVGILVILAYHVLTAVYPPRAFYEKEFALRTGLAMPNSATIVFKKASYPDFHGDYSCEVLFEVSKEDFEWLERAAKCDSLTGVESGMGMNRRDVETAYGKPLQAVIYGSIRKRHSDESGSWMLLNDMKTVYFWFAQT